jgi:hypothetical protein
LISSSETDARDLRLDIVVVVVVRQRMRRQRPAGVEEAERRPVTETTIESTE